jgi:hypothetical protein
VARRSWAGEIENAINLSGDVQWLANIVVAKREVRVIEQRADIAHRAGEEIIDTNDGIASLNQIVANVGPDEAGAARYDDAMATAKGCG